MGDLTGTDDFSISEMLFLQVISRTGAVMSQRPGSPIIHAASSSRCTTSAHELRLEYWLPSSDSADVLSHATAEQHNTLSSQFLKYLQRNAAGRCSGFSEGL